MTSSILKHNALSFIRRMTSRKSVDGSQSAVKSHRHVATSVATTDSSVALKSYLAQFLVVHLTISGHNRFCAFFSASNIIIIIKRFSKCRLTVRQMTKKNETKMKNKFEKYRTHIFKSIKQINANNSQRTPLRGLVQLDLIQLISIKIDFINRNCHLCSF